MDVFATCDIPARANNLDFRDGLTVTITDIRFGEIVPGPLCRAYSADEPLESRMARTPSTPDLPALLTPDNNVRLNSLPTPPEIILGTR